MIDLAGFLALEALRIGGRRLLDARDRVIGKAAVCGVFGVYFLCNVAHDSGFSRVAFWCVDGCDHGDPVRPKGISSHGDVGGVAFVRVRRRAVPRIFPRDFLRDDLGAACGLTDASDSLLLRKL
jgi:hypothetical protein